MIDKEIEIEVKKIYESHAKAGIYGLILEEVGDLKRKFPIVIGEKEALTIHNALNHIMTPRPQTQDLMVSCFDFANIELLKVLIYKVDVGVYYSYIYLKRDDEFTRIDSRTSDALALALKTDAPIYVLEDVLEKESLEDYTKEKEFNNFTNRFENEMERKAKEKETLEQKLRQAIEKEDYELASVLRDRIAEIE